MRKTDLRAPSYSICGPHIVDTSALPLKHDTRDRERSRLVKIALLNGAVEAIMAKSRVNLPVDSIYEQQRSLHSVELASYLATDHVSDKKPSRLTDVAFHSVRPWLAAVDPKGAG